MEQQSSLLNNRYDLANLSAGAQRDR